MPNYPYISGQGSLVATVAQLRKGFPAKVDAGYLQRFNLAPANESYFISILRFLGLIDSDGNRVEDKTEYFYGNDDSFKSGLDSALRSAYSQLFGEMGDDALDTKRRHPGPLVPNRRQDLGPRGQAPGVDVPDPRGTCRPRRASGRSEQRDQEI